MRVAAPALPQSPSAVGFGALVAAGLVIASAMPIPWPLLVVLFIAPALEETVFRAGLHDGLLHAGAAPWLANLSTALAFTAAHVALLGASAQTMLMLLPALLIGSAYNRWRRLRFCIALHMAMNALWIAVHRMT